MQTDSLVPTVKLLLELVAVASLCGWSACLAIGMSLFTPDKAILTGTSGIVIGGAIWQLLQLPAGPWMGHFAIVPSFFGTLIVALVAELALEIRDSPFRRPATVPAAVRAAPSAGASDAPAAATAAASPASPVHDAPPPATREAR
jgi:hypothetical protein